MTNKTLKSILFTGSIVAGSLLSTNTASANQGNPFNFTDLGSGSQVRAALLDNLVSQKYNFDLSCGEKSKDNANKENKSKEGKCGEGKCGEGKCGGKEDSTKMKTSDVKKMEDKSKEGKCGEGKCGENKSTDKKNTDKK